MRHSKIFAILLAGTMLNGCQTMTADQRRTMATTIGGITGAIVGSQIGGDKEARIVAALVGGALGAYAGNLIANHLNEQDQTAVGQHTAMVLESGGDGQTSSWKSGTSDATGTVSVENTHVATRSTSYVRSANVEAHQMDLIGETYQSNTSANVRAAPSTSSSVVASLSQGESFGAVGKVVGQEWIMASRDGRSIGYVHSSLVSKATETSATPIRQAIDLDAAMNNEAVVVETVSAEVECRDIKTSITNEKGVSQNSSHTACKAPDGAWEIA